MYGGRETAPSRSVPGQKAGVEAYTLRPLYFTVHGPTRFLDVQESHPLIAREGWPHVAIALGLALVATAFLGGWSLLFWGLAAFVVQFFRDPPRIVPQLPGIAVS